MKYKKEVLIKRVPLNAGLYVRHSMFSKKARRKMRSLLWPDMKPHIFDKLVRMLPSVLKGIKY